MVPLPACRCACVAFVGLAVHGVVPLQPNILEVAMGKPNVGIEITSIVHQGTGSLTRVFLFRCCIIALLQPMRDDT